MIIGSVSENKNTEKRISVTPDNVKKFISNGFKVYLEKNYANHLDIDDNKFSENGAEIFDNKEKIIKESDILLQLNLPNENDLNTNKFFYIGSRKLIPQTIRIVSQGYLIKILMFFH